MSTVKRASPRDAAPLIVRAREAHPAPNVPTRAAFHARDRRSEPAAKRRAEQRVVARDSGIGGEHQRVAVVSLSLIAE
jgi:hypothetical protein